jgi:ribosome maturation factor RimP
MASNDSIRALAEPVLAASGLELWDVERSGDTVRFLVERPGGVDLDALTAASGLLSALLDEHDELVPDRRWNLELSSPGVERALRTPEHYRRCVGSLVSVKTTEVVGGVRRLQGILGAVTEDGVVIAAGPSAEAEPIALAWEQIDRARTVLVWGPAPKPRSAPPGGPRRDPKPVRTAKGSPRSALQVKDVVR